MRKKVKTICTLGPSSNTYEKINDLVEAGMDVARLNFSHGTHSDHSKVYELVRKVAHDNGKSVGIMADLQGPKIRISDFSEEKFVLVEKGEEIKIISKNIPSVGKTFGCTYENLSNDVKPGDKVLIDDGNIRLKVREVKGDEITLIVKVGGKIKPHKGINLPGVDVSSPALTEKDLKDLEFAISLPVDFIALSFVRKREDVLQARQIIHKHGKYIPVIAKIEREEGIENIESILQICNGIMVARGDMGVELSPEKVPAIQKRLIKMANINGKTVIVATQMLESMTDKPVPTRAEASDVANAILDGTDCTMLSGETAAGNYPVEAVKMMEKIGLEAEAYFFKRKEGKDIKNKITDKTVFSHNSVCHAAVTMATRIKAKAIVIYTSSGKTAQLVSKHRPSMPVLAITRNTVTSNRASVYWGVEPYLINKEMNGTDELIEWATEAALNKKLAEPGDFIVITAGIPTGRPGATNLIKVHMIPYAEDDIKDILVCDQNNIKISIDKEKCIDCGYCVNICPFQVFSLYHGKIKINDENVKHCTKEGKCVNGCPLQVISVE